VSKERSDDELAELGHRNLIAYCLAGTRWNQRGEVREGVGLLAYFGGSWLPVGCNGAFRTSDAVEPAELIAWADGYFGSRGRGYSIKVRDTDQDDEVRAACTAHGLRVFSEPAPQMVCRARLAVPELPAGVQLRRVEDAAGVADFVAVNTEAYATYGMPTDVMADLFDRPDAVVADPDTAIVVAYAEGRAVATALVFVSDGTSSLQWVGTRSEARHLHLGRAVTVWATNEAFDRGAGSCTLQASPMGAPLYRKLGYQTLYHYAEHVRWKVPDGTPA
jgi:ribosomal protein S18 acetylase RimI-like enzyme